MGAVSKGFAADKNDSKKFDNKYETCVCCYKKIKIFKNEEIEFRPFYIEGAGQLCYDCYHELYTKR